MRCAAPIFPLQAVRRRPTPLHQQPLHSGLYQGAADMASNYISFPRVEGRASRQAHADLPEGTFERELGKEGFFGPATMMYHKHPPTGWTRWEGPLRPRAFDLARL